MTNNGSGATITEEFSALVPLVRTIILHLEEYVQKLEFEKNPKAAVIKNLAIEKVLETKMQELIINATELNPRDVKRFINSIVISHESYGQEIDDIENIIVIQAFYFHGDKWIEFFKLLIPYKQRIAFLTRFIL